jgi:phosphatidylserine/phosphatidylglycerophosphate/cardiolipin synthase-like enzyme
MKKILNLMLIFALTISSVTFAQSDVSISSIRANNSSGEPFLSGQTFTIKGLVTSSNQFGNSGPASIQDSSAGISIYGSSFANTVQIGDSVILTSSLTHYNGLTQLDAAAPTILSSGNPVEPKIVTLSQVTNQTWDGVEEYESKLVRINGVSITGSGNFDGGTSGRNYPISDSTGSLNLRIDESVSTLVGSPIPSGEVDLIGIVSQFKYGTPYNSGYQIIPRDINDLISEDVPLILTPVIGSNITTNSFTVYFNTVRNGNSEVSYGKTEELELGNITQDKDTTEHQIEITGLEEFTKYYYKVFSTNDVGTSESSLKTILTMSSNPETGTINIYFNHDVDTTVAISGNAANGNVNLTEKVISRINQAVYSIDIALYSFYGLLDVEHALISAKNRGIRIRFVYDEREIQSGAKALLDAGILMNQKPDNSGLMHNKFAIIDARDDDPTNDWVWTGSWNWRDSKWYNNAIEINDPMLAETYTVEFEEMWGSNTDIPDSANAKFGKYKTDNTSHNFTIGGIEIESYFSPSDQTESHIVNSISSADTSVYFGLLSFTSNPISEAIQDMHNNYSMNDCRGIISDANNQGSEFDTLLFMFPGEIFDDNAGEEKLHHKFGLVDSYSSTSDPQTITGSHNWSASANEKNDENTLIIHDLYIANQYMQAFKAMYNFMGGTSDFDVPTIVSVNEDESIPTEFVLEQNYPNPFNPSTTINYSIPVETFRGMSATNVTLKIFDILGREVATLVNKEQSAGSYSVTFDASSLTSGMYFYKLQYGSSVQTKKMMLLK